MSTTETPAQEPASEKQPTAPASTPAPESPIQVTPIDASTLVADLADNMPEVTPGIDEKKEGPPPDVNGYEFRPGYHAAHEDGTPKVDSIGRYYPASTGRPKKAQFADPKRGKPAPGSKKAPPPVRPAPTFAKVPTGAGAPPPAQEGGGAGFADAAPEFATNPDARFEVMAESYLSMAYVPVVGLLGVEAKPDLNEHAALKQALVPVLKLYDLEDFHPLVGFVAVAGGVALVKAEKPSVRQRFAALLARFKKREVNVTPAPSSGS